MKQINCFLLVLLFSGCSLLQPELMPTTASEERLSGTQELCAQRLLDNDAAAVKNLRLLLIGEIKVNGVALPLRIVIAQEGQEALRLEFIRPVINQLESIIIVKDGLITGFSASRQMVCQEKQDDQNFNTVLGLPLTAKEIGLWALGRMKLPLSAKIYRLEDGAARFVAEADLSDNRQLKILFSADQADLCRATTVRPSALQIAAREFTLYSNYRYRQAATWPEEVKVIIPEGDWESLFQVSGVGVNNNWDNIRDRLFRFELPPSASYVRCENLVINPLSTLGK